MEWHSIKMNQKFAKWVLESEQSIFSIIEGGVRSGKNDHNDISIL